jgi:hypothetical protein
MYEREDAGVLLESFEALCKRLGEVVTDQADQCAPETLEVFMLLTEVRLVLEKLGPVLAQIVWRESS